MKLTKVRQWFIDNELDFETLQVLDDNAEIGSCAISGVTCNVIRCTCDDTSGGSIDLLISERTLACIGM